MDMPRVLIAGTRSGSGKTLISIGLMKALESSGYSVSPFKVGPDYIDPMYHKDALGRNSRNLDSFMMDSWDLVGSFMEGARDNDLSIIEGVMGLYDSHDGVDEKGSTSQLSKILGAPVILVVDVSKTARSAAAIVSGFRDFDPHVDLAGVILNRVGSLRHSKKVREAVEKLSGAEVLGTVPRCPSLHIPERHLGLVPAHETNKDIEEISRIITEYVDLSRILEISKSAPKISVGLIKRPKKIGNGPRVGVMYDKVFRFYYADTMDQIRRFGTLIKIDSLKDKGLPPLDVLYIGGGFPEVFAKELEKNKSLLNSIYDFCSSGGRVYAECGGLMYLGENICTRDGEFEMTGFLPISTVMQDRYMGMGYVNNVVLHSNFIGATGTNIVGHEFHHSMVVETGKLKYAYKTIRGNGIDGEHDGIIKNNVLASYMHIHPLGYKEMVKNLLNVRSYPV